MARFFRRNNLRLRPVNRIKHVVDIQGALPLNTVVTNDLIDTVDTPTLSDVNGVETGSKCYGIYLKVEVVRTQATSGVLTNAYMSVFKNPGGSITMSAPNIIGGDKDKKYSIHQEMIMTEQQGNGNPRILFNGVIAIPRGYQRNGPEDKLQIHLLSPGGTMNFCLQCHYKEFR